MEGDSSTTFENRSPSSIRRESVFWFSDPHFFGPKTVLWFQVALQARQCQKNDFASKSLRT